MTAEWPNLEEKQRGDYVENVHPCNAGRYPLGIVRQSYEGSLDVAIGTGSSVYGPAEHWRKTDRRPEWLDRPRIPA